MRDAAPQITVARGIVEIDFSQIEEAERRIEALQEKAKITLSVSAGGTAGGPDDDEQASSPVGQLLTSLALISTTLDQLNASIQDIRLLIQEHADR